MSPRRKLRRRLVIGDENNDRKQQPEEEVVAPENHDGKRQQRRQRQQRQQRQRQQRQQQEEKQEKEEVAPAPDATNNNLEEEHQSDSDSSMNSLSKFILKPIGCPGGYVKEDKEWEEVKINNDNEKKVNEKVKNKKSGGEDEKEKEKEKDGSIAGGRDLVLGLACQGGNNVIPSKGKKLVKDLPRGEASGNSIASRKGKRIVKALQTGETSGRKTVKKQKIEKLEESDLREKVIIDLTEDEKKFVCLKEYLKEVELQEDRRGVVMERLFTLGEKRLEEFDIKCQSLRHSELELSLKKKHLAAEVLRAAGFTV